MKPSSDLHQLIRSLNMSEKRYFKIHSARHVIGDRNNYLRLFDAISRQEVYAEDELRKKFAGETFIRHLPSEKHYLYRQVLECLNAFNRDKTFLSRYAGLLVSIEILYNRGLFAQSERLIRKAKKEAYRLEKFSVLLILLRLETLIHIKNEDEQKLNRNMTEELRVLDMMRVQYVLMQIAFNVQVQIHKGRATPAFIRTSEKLLKKNLPKDEFVDSFWARYYYHSTMGLIASVQKKNMLRYQSYKEIRRIMDTAPQFIMDLPGIYHLNSNNLVAMMFLLKKYGEAEVLIGQQRRFMAQHHIKRPALAKTIFLQTYENELFLLYKTGRYAECTALADRIAPEVKKIEPGFSPLLYDLLFFMAVAALAGHDHKGASKWLNRILQAEKPMGLRKELQVNARLLYLVVLYESGDRLLENRIQSARRFLHREPQFKAEKKIVEFIRMRGEEASRRRNAPLLKGLPARIRQDLKASSEESLYKQFDFAGWVEKHAR
jgi:hypothetical protein